MNEIVGPILIVLFLIACYLAGEIAMGFARRQQKKSGGAIVTIHVDTPDAESFKKMGGRDWRTISRELAEGRHHSQPPMEPASRRTIHAEIPVNRPSFIFPDEPIIPKRKPKKACKPPCKPCKKPKGKKK